MARRNRWSGSLVLALALLVCVAPAASAQPQLRAINFSLEQCANRLGGTTASINNCTGSAWTSGSVNQNSSLYREGDFVPMRTEINDLSAGTTYTLRLGYDATRAQGGGRPALHAFDYLGTYDASAFAGQQIVPCDGISVTGSPTCNNPPSTTPVPLVHGGREHSRAGLGRAHRQFRGLGRRTDLRGRGKREFVPHAVGAIPGGGRHAGESR